MVDVSGKDVQRLRYSDREVPHRGSPPQQVDMVSGASTQWGHLVRGDIYREGTSN